MTLTTKGRKILEQIQVKLLQFPEKFDIDFWVREADCGTTLCIGGWACALAYPKGSFSHGYFRTSQGKKFQHPADIAAKVLAESDEFTSEEETLFLRSAWPMEFQNRFRNARTDRQRAIVGIQRIQSLLDDGV